MKRLLAILASVILLPSLLWAQAPQGIAYQAVARDGSGNPLANHTVSVRFTIKDNSSNGNTDYQETFSGVTTNQFGLFTLQIGTGTSVVGTFSAINWSVNLKFLQVEFDPNNGTAYLDMGTTELLSVPYALYAAKAGSGDKDSLIINGNQLGIFGGNTVTLPAGGSGGDNWGTQTAVTNSTLQGNGTLGSPLGIAQQGAVPGQILQWNGLDWAPATNNSASYTAGSGIGISGNTITNTAPDQTVTITGSGLTSVTGTYPNFNVSSNDSLFLNGNTLAIKGGNSVVLPSSGSGGDNWGTQVAVTNSTLQGNGTFSTPLGLAQQGATNGQVLKWNGLVWAPAADANTTYTAGSGITISGTTISNASPNQPVSLTGAGSTTVSGSYPNFTISSTGGSSYTAGTGITISGTTISNSEPDQVVNLTGTGATTVTGVYPNFTINSTGGSNYTAGSGLSLTGTTFSNNAQTDATLTGIGTTASPLKIAPQGATNGEVLKWNGTTWMPAADANTTYTAGTGISITGTTITNTSPNQSVSITGTGGTTVTGSYPSFTVSSTAPVAYVAGTGISISGNTISNTSPNQSVSITGGGATTVTGTYPNFTVSSTNTTYTAGSGLSLAGTAFSNDAQTDATLAGIGTTASPLKIAQQGATSNQVLQWNGTTWAPATIAGSTPAWNLTGNTGIDTSLNFLGTTDAKNVIIKTNGTERLRIMGSGTNPGFVGIGTKNPTSNLHVLASNAIVLVRLNNTNANGYAVYGINSAATGTGTGAGVVGVTSQSTGFALGGENLNRTGTGLIVSESKMNFNLIGIAVTDPIFGNYNLIGGGASITGQHVGLQVVDSDASELENAAIFSFNSATGTEADLNLFQDGIQYKVFGDGSVSTVIKDQNNNKVVMFAPESPEILFTDYGSGTLENGVVHITLDPILTKNIFIDDKHPLRVFIQLEDNENCKGVVVKNKTATGFDVVELSGGKSNTSFQYQIVGNRADETYNNGRVSKNSTARFPRAPHLTLMKSSKNLSLGTVSSQ